MRWHRVVILVGIFLTALMLTIVHESDWARKPDLSFVVSSAKTLKSKDDPESDTRLASASEFSEILLALIDEDYPQDKSPSAVDASTRKQIVLQNETVSFCDSGPGCDIELEGNEYLGVNPSRIPLWFRTALVRSVTQPSRIPCPASRWVICASKEDIDAAFKKGGDWKGFYKKYPKSSGYMEVSNAVISPGLGKAILYTSHSCGGLCGVGMLVRLIYVGKKWKVETRDAFWMS